MRTIDTETIIKTVSEMCIEASHFLTPDMKEALDKAKENEISPLGKQV